MAGAQTEIGQSKEMTLLYRVAVLVTSHNRRVLTLASLTSLFEQHGINDVALSVFLVDDGSTDGTGDAVRLRFPRVHVLQGDGSLFWDGGMRVAFAAARQKAFDAYIFLNDDTVLYKDAMARIVACARSRLAEGTPSIVAGSTRSPVSGKHSYGGFSIRTRGPVLCLEKIEPRPTSTVRCDTMNGNFALIPREIAEIVGNIETRFCHHFGDFDYGLRAKRAGFDVVVASGFLGECAENSSADTWRDSRLSLRTRWHHLHSPKGMPFGEWCLFTTRHYGWRSVYYMWSPYAKTIVSGLIGLLSGRHRSTRLEART